MHGPYHVIPDRRHVNLSGSSEEPQKPSHVVSQKPVHDGCASERAYILAQGTPAPLSESARLCLIVGGGFIRTFLLLGLLAAIQHGWADPRIGTLTLMSAQSSLEPPTRSLLRLNMMACMLS